MPKGSCCVLNRYTPYNSFKKHTIIVNAKAVVLHSKTPILPKKRRSPNVIFDVSKAWRKPIFMASSVANQMVAVVVENKTRTLCKAVIQKLAFSGMPLLGLVFSRYNRGKPES